MIAVFCCDVWVNEKQWKTEVFESKYSWVSREAAEITNNCG
jgi:hypothetical protein